MLKKWWFILVGIVIILVILGLFVKTPHEANWQNYENQKNGFALKYPGNWQFEGEQDVPPSPYFIHRWGGNSYCRFNVVTSNSASATEIADLKSKGFTETQINVGGVSAIKLSKSPVGANNESNDYVYFNRSGNYYRVERMSFADANESACISDFNQVLATFEFVNQASYKCDGDKSIQAVFYTGQPAPVKPGQPPIPNGSVNLSLSDGRKLSLPQTLSADGIRFANSDESFIFWSTGDTAFINEGNTETYKNCVVVK